MIYMIGDTHGEDTFFKMGNSYIKKLGLDVPTKDDTLFHVGDLGYIWDQENNIKAPEKYLKDWTSKKPWKILTAGGNHENWERVLKLPLVPAPWPGSSPVYKYTDNIFYAIRGGLYRVENKTFFFMGGATSTDISYRKEGLSWWPEEIPSLKEFDDGVSILDSVNMEVDYVVTHTFPWEVIQLLGFYNYTTCPVSAYLNQLLRFGIKFKEWYGGHFHIDKTVDSPYGKFTCLYDDIKIIK